MMRILPCHSCGKKPEIWRDFGHYMVQCTAGCYDGESVAHGTKLEVAIEWWNEDQEERCES